MATRQCKADTWCSRETSSRYWSQRLGLSLSLARSTPWGLYLQWSSHLHLRASLRHWSQWCLPRNLLGFDWVLTLSSCLQQLTPGSKCCPASSLGDRCGSCGGIPQSRTEKSWSSGWALRSKVVWWPGCSYQSSFYRRMLKGSSGQRPGGPGTICLLMGPRRSQRTNWFERS